MRDWLLLLVPVLLGPVPVLVLLVDRSSTLILGAERTQRCARHPQRPGATASIFLVSALPASPISPSPTDNDRHSCLVHRPAGGGGICIGRGCEPSDHNYTTLANEQGPVGL